MKRYLAILSVAIALSGCASLQRLETAYAFVTEATVSPQQVYIAANTFDGLQSIATQYLVYCRSNLATPPCTAANRRVVIRGVRSGRAARNQLETYLTQSQPAPAQIYNTLIAAITSLQSSAAAKGAAK